ncbi:hypothetical protein KIPB_010346, partial [Kipferlia bialata]
TYAGLRDRERQATMEVQEHTQSEKRGLGAPPTVPLSASAYTTRQREAYPSTPTTDRSRMPRSSLAMSIRATHSTEQRQPEWVKVFGLPADCTTNMLLGAFARAGEVVSMQQGRGNWLYVRFSTRVGAANATAMSPVTLEDGSLVGVSVGEPPRMDTDREREEGGDVVRVEPMRGTVVASKV